MLNTKTTAIPFLYFTLLAALATNSNAQQINTTSGDQPTQTEQRDTIGDLFFKMPNQNNDRKVCLTEVKSGEIQMIEVNSVDTCVAPPTVAEEANNDCPNLNNFLRERTIEVGSGVSLTSRNIGIDLDWEFRLRPSFRSEAFLRTDVWSPRIYLRAPWDVFSFSIARNGRFVYTTNYPNACAAANPINAKTPFDLPNTADKAILKMRTNDYVRVDMETNFALNANDFSNLFSLGSTPMGVGIDGYYILSGGFQVHINKLDSKRVRLWIVTDPSETVGAEVRFGVASVVNVTGTKMLDKAITRVFKLKELLSFGVEAQTSVITLFDTTLDLTDPEAAHAYNEALDGFLKLDIPNATEFIDAIPQAIADRSLLAMAEQLYQLPINNLGPLFEIARGNARMDHCRSGTGEGTSEPCVPTSVVLNNDISNRASTSTVGWKIGVSEIISTENETVYRENRITKTNYSRGQEDFTRKFLIPTWQHNVRDESVFGGTILEPVFGKGTQRVIRQANAIFLADTRWSPSRFLTMAFAYNERDTAFSADEMKVLLQKIKRILPNEYIKLEMILQENGWLNFANGDKEGIEIQLKYSFKEEGYIKLFGDPRFSRSNNLKPILYDYFKQLQNGRLLPDMRSANFYKSRLDTLSEVLAEVFNPKLTSQKRYEKFDKLRESDLFVEFGPGILVHLALLQSPEINQLMSFKLLLFGRKELPIEYKFGEDENQELADVVSFTEDILNRLDNDGVVVFGEAPLTK